MPIESTTIVTYVCDKCSFSSENHMERGGYAQGNILNGESVSFWLCGACAIDLHEFLYPTP